MDLSSKKIAIVTHESISRGPAHELKDYLLKHSVSSLLFIVHSLLYSEEDFKKSSRYEFYRKEKKTKITNAFHWILPVPVLFIKDVFYTFFWCGILLDKIDIFFGVDPLNAFVGILLKKIGRVKKVVYYSIDYSPSRFKNPILNYIYHATEKFCCYNADTIWIGTKRTQEMWFKTGFSKNKMAKTIVVPDGNYSLTIKRQPIYKIKMNQLVYLGFLDRKQGIELVLESLPLLLKKIPNIKFTVIGTGDYLPNLKEKTQQLGLRCVTFTGHLDDHKVQTILTKSGIGVATYIQDKDSFTYYSDPGKPKYYLGCGLPVIITKVPQIAYEIEKQKAGIAINYSKEEFINAVLEISDKKKYASYKNNAEKMGLNFDWSIIFKKALMETFEAF